MKLPGFSAEISLYRTDRQYSRAATEALASSPVVPQDCGFFKRVGCVLGPFSWCAPAGLGGAEPFWNCVDKLSGGNCLDCIGGADSRDRDPGREPDDYAGVDYGSGSGFVGHGTKGLTSGSSGSVVVGPPPSLGQRDSDPCNVRRQLNRIERCACGYKGVVQAPPSWFGQSYAVL